MAAYSLRQDFRWHDVSGNYDYRFGSEGYMVFDGRRQLVHCRRELVQVIGGPEGAIELSARVTLGVPGQEDSYEILLLSGEGCPVACLEIRRSDGRIFSTGPEGPTDSGQVLSFQGGRPFNDTSLRKWYVVDSDEHTFRFDAFDFDAGRTRFRLDDEDPVWIPFVEGAGDVAGLEFRTEEVGAGRRMRLRRLTQFSGEETVDTEEFSVDWEPVPAPVDGMPDDNVCDSLLRPVDHQWLEVTTRYGFVTASVPAIPKGTFEFDLMMPDVSQEACIILGEADGTMKAFRKIQTGIITGRFPVAPEGGGFHNFDDPVTPENDRCYRYRIFWDAATNKQRIWIDDVPQKYQGSEEIEIYGDWSRPKHLVNGIDTISLHPGRLGTVRLTAIQKAQGMKEPLPCEPLRTRWGRFRLDAQ